MKARRSFNDDAARADEPPEVPSTACCAHGCPLPAGIIRDGKRFCCVHLDVANWDNYGAATGQIRKRTGLVAAINLLRSPGQMSETQVMSEACALWPELSPDAPHPYALLLEAEMRIRKASLTGGDAIYNQTPDVSLLQQLRTVSKRMPK